MNNEIMQQVLAVEDMPTPPGVACRLLQIYDQDDIELAEIAKVIGADPVLSAKLIDYCNSPILARSRRTSSIDQAVVALGMRTVKMIGLSFSLMQTIPNRPGLFDFKQFWNKSLATAIVARTISHHLKQDRDAAFLLGLVMNIGQMAMAHVFRDRYVEMMKQAQQQDACLIALEFEEWGINHYQLGGQILHRWKFPEWMAESVSGISQEYDEANESQMVLHLAEQIAELLFREELHAHQAEAVKNNARLKLGIAGQIFNDLFDEAVEFWKEYAKLLNFDHSRAVTFEKLQSRALQGIADLSLGMHLENTEIRNENAILKSNALTDPLTGLKNRRAYRKEAEAELDRCRRSESPFVMMMLDIDRFKLLNDSYGHAAGDAVLVKVAETLVDQMRKYDSIFRIGGEEFVVLLANCDAKVAKSVAERFRSSIENFELHFNGEFLNITMSVGVCICTEEYPTLDQVFQQADQLMYQAKSLGRNRCCVADSEETCSQEPCSQEQNSGDQESESAPFLSSPVPLDTNPGLNIER